MLAANISEAEAESFIKDVPPDDGKAVVACVNSHSSVTLSGDRAAIICIQRKLEERKIFVRRLAVGTAYHSHHMKVIKGTYETSMQALPMPKLNQHVTFVSSVTGGPMRGDVLDAGYWVKNMVSQVRFLSGLEALAGMEAIHHLGTSMGARFSGTSTVQTLVEISPHGALAGFAKQTFRSRQGVSLRHISTLSQGKNAVDTMLDRASQLTISAYPVDLGAVNSHGKGIAPRVLVNLPPYPWDHGNSHWHESRLSIDYQKRCYPRHPLLGAPTPDFN